MQAVNRGLPESNNDPPDLVETKRKPPTFLSPRWFWSIVVVMFTMLTPAFWKRLKDPEIQGYWHASSYVTLGWIAAGSAALQWVELHAPWVVKVATLLASAVKAIVTATVTFLVALWNIATP